MVKNLVLVNSKDFFRAFLCAYNVHFLQNLHHKKFIKNSSQIFHIWFKNKYFYKILLNTIQMDVKPYS